VRHNVRLSSHFSSKNSTWWLSVLFVWFSIAKILASFYFFRADDSIFNLSFGFGSYIESLYETGQFSSCANNVCDYATRMPLIPLVFSAIAHISKSTLIAAIIKNTALSGIVFFTFAYLLRMQITINKNSALVWCFVSLVLSLSPPVVKHASSIYYEEGFLVELMFLWTFSLLVTTQLLSGTNARGEERSAVILCTIFGLTAFFIKSSMILVLVLSCALALSWAIKFRDLKVLIIIFLSVTAVVTWGIRNKLVTDRFDVMTSWDGPNAYRGWSENGFNLYPDVVLDRLFDSAVAYKANGETVTIKSIPTHEQFSSEWASNDYYRALAKNWLIDHPWDGVKFSLIKAYMFFVDIRKTPYTYTNDARAPSDQSWFEGIVTSVWLLVGRAFELMMLALMVMLWRKKDSRARILVLSVVAANTAYAAPYLLGFNYERHVTVYLVLVAVCVAVMSAEFLERKKNGRRQNVRD
jgi:hypothetical protein